MSSNKQENDGKDKRTEQAVELLAQIFVDYLDEKIEEKGTLKEIVQAKHDQIKRSK